MSAAMTTKDAGKMKRLIAALLVGAAIMSPAIVQAQIIHFVGPNGYDPHPVSAADPLPVTGSFSSSNASVGANGAASPSSSSLTGYQNGSGNTVQDSTSNPHPVVDSALAALVGQGVGSTAATAPAQAIYMGCRGTTANPTAVTDGQLVAPMCSKLGKVVYDLFAPSDLRVRGKTTGTDNAAHTIIAAGAGSLKNYITDIQCSRNDAGTSPITLTFSDDVSSTMMLPNAGNGGVNNFHTSSPLATAAATAFTFTASTGTTTVSCNAQGFQAP